MDNFCWICGKPLFNDEKTCSSKCNAYYRWGLQTSLGFDETVKGWKYKCDVCKKIYFRKKPHPRASLNKKFHKCCSKECFAFFKKQTILQKYGSIENYKKIWIEKRNSNNLKKYGNKNASTPESKEKYKKTCLQRYGVTHVGKLKKVIESHVKKTKWNQENLIKAFKLLHSDKYDYSKMKYTGILEKIVIICPDHGPFLKTPSDHLSGGGCPFCCKKSKMELIVANYLLKNKIKFWAQYSFKKCKDKRPLPFDFFIPSKNLLIECQGKQHYDIKSFIKITGNWNGFYLLKYHDFLKKEWAGENKYQLLEINYKQLKQIPKLLDDWIF